MKLARLTLVPLVPLAMLAAPAWSAMLDREMPSVFYDGMNAKLINNGYHDVRVLDPETGRLVAYDPDGSEVCIVVDTETGKILQTTYVHPSDK
ncbi:hypothetical protein [Tropicimonas isoalkanivorans]|uniref:Peptidase propeptide and YPEB domain-containing protein n=1 Tax=Tropicimonas isoalkanivorans TaxID=441112 RepID=A0A1I1FTI4_9RHOB|nr:hypothetical protein [Tropicimonas isoalkanivorans]SFC02869.1 hypothetical protein SAMN04488094_102288 [Tropicimonas isoalkanivorans]